MILCRHVSGFSRIVPIYIYITYIYIYHISLWIDFKEDDMVTKEKLKVRLGLLQIVGDGFMRFAEADGFFFQVREYL